MLLIDLKDSVYFHGDAEGKGGGAAPTQDGRKSGATQDQPQKGPKGQSPEGKNGGEGETRSSPRT